ncbi:MAG: Rrf2 family transcriptional regulator [Candidatus Omnitrophota bacterium]
MRLSKKGEYALKAMIELALRHNTAQGTEAVQTRAISEKEKIPGKFLEQILLELKKAGLLQSRRGIGGGYNLLEPPDKITLARIIRTIDGPLAPLSCVSKWAHITCPRENDCGLYSVMLEVRNAISNILENITLADVCERTKTPLIINKKNKK